MVFYKLWVKCDEKIKGTILQHGCYGVNIIWRIKDNGEKNIFGQ